MGLAFQFRRQTWRHLDQGIEIVGDPAPAAGQLGELIQGADVQHPPARDDTDALGQFLRLVQTPALPAREFGGVGLGLGPETDHVDELPGREGIRVERGEMIDDLAHREI